MPNLRRTLTAALIAAALSLPSEAYLGEFLPVIVVSINMISMFAFIITLGTWLIASGAAAYITRGYPIVFPSGHPFLVFGQEEIWGIPIMFIVLVVVAVVASIILNLTTLGRHIYAVGSNEEAARLSGISVEGFAHCVRAEDTASHTIKVISKEEEGGISTMMLIIIMLPPQQLGSTPSCHNAVLSTLENPALLKNRP